MVRVIMAWCPSSQIVLSHVYSVEFAYALAESAFDAFAWINHVAFLLFSGDRSFRADPSACATTRAVFVDGKSNKFLAHASWASLVFDVLQIFIPKVL
jgi:hypothetical protein